MTTFLIILVLAIGIIAYICYVGVIKARNQLDEALSGMDVQLKKRSDLIPNILTLAQKFMTHEKAIFTEITKLRTEVAAAQIGTKERFEMEAELQNKMRELSISVENYPDLKSADTVVKAMETYNDTEANIAASRRFYNSALKQLNDKIKIFPTSLFKSFAGDLSNITYFEATQSEKQNVKASDYLK